MKRARIPRAGLIAAALVLIVIAAGGYAARRLWLKSDDLLQPVVIMRGDDARAMVKPSLGVRIAALTGSTRAPLGAPQRLVALTFDDGPYPVTTPLLLQTLHDLGVPATFFLIGRDAEQFPSLAKAIVASGNEIADHTLTHPDLDKLGAGAVRGELLDGAAMLGRIAPDPAERRLFRPPHGRYTLETIRAAQAAGFDTILWSDDPGDWRSISGATLRAHVLSHATTPEIVLLHSGMVATVASLPDLVARFRKAGYTFVTVGELLRRSSATELNRPAKSPLAAG
jgi:peptidoglycan/xylan/chitin deacetylase (PgdA/CDA1 family)